MIHRMNIRTRSRIDFQDISRQIQDAVQTSGIKDGVCHLFVPHTTAAITINENADPSVAEDITAQLEALIPQHSNYRHLEGNAPAHIKASLIGNSLALLVENGRLVLGTWQGIFFCEFDGPRNRTMLLKITPDQLEDRF